VEEAEALAEDIQTYLEQSAWPAAETKLANLKGMGDKLTSAGVAQAKRSAYESSLDSLAAAITRRSRADALPAANRVSRVVARIMADYPTKVPVEVTWMDVAGRDALYAAAQGRWSDAANAVAEAARNYAVVQPHVRATDAALDRQVTTELAELQRADRSHAPARVARLAQALLENVDRIEQTF
jgi:hypothetical protein